MGEPDYKELYKAEVVYKETILAKEIEKLEGKIAAHNEECIRACELARNSSHMGCDPRYGPDKRRTCPECPRGWMIEG